MPDIHLYPTKTRLALLQRVADGSVYEPSWEPGTFWSENGAPTTVSASIRDMHQAGWVTYVDPTRDIDLRLRQVTITDRGREVLAEGSR